MKKEYVSPEIKVKRLSVEPLMGVSVTDEEIVDGFTEGAKEMNLDYDDSDDAVYTNLSVWDD